MKIWYLLALLGIALAMTTFLAVVFLFDGIPLLVIAVVIAVVIVGLMIRQLGRR